MSPHSMRGAGPVNAEIPYVDATVDRIDIHYDRPAGDVAVERHCVPVHNGRLLSPRPSLDLEGFCLFDWPSAVVRDRREELIRENGNPHEGLAAVNAAYLDELLPLIEQLCGAREVFAQYGTTTVRFSSRARERSWMSTSAFAHFDFEASAVDRLLADTLEITGRRVRPFRRQVLYQTWRVITDPPQDVPLALCDGRSVRSGDIIPMDFHGPAGSRNAYVKSRAGRFSPEHRWVYYPDMTPDEVLVFKGFDSEAPEGRTAMHTAFDDAAVTDAVPRGSIECRFIALYD